MSFRINASVIKYWFQYRCERKLVYDSLPSEVKNLLPVEQVKIQSSWSEYGNEFEATVVRELNTQSPRGVLGPARDANALTETQSRAFLSLQRSETYAHQLLLHPNDTLIKKLKLPDGVVIGLGRPDLVEVRRNDETTTFRLIDIKATQVATLFHKTQVAFYALMLRAMLEELGLAYQLENEAAIWHIPPPSATPGQLWKEERFPLRGYEASVLDFFHREVPRIKQRRVEPGHDDTPFHLYFKCEQCSYVTHCEKTIQGPNPGDWDISAVPGLSQESKRALKAMDVHTVESLANSVSPKTLSQNGSWALRTRRDALISRACSLLDGKVNRLPERYTWLMPPTVDVAIFLVADRDPGDGVLVTLGCLVQKSGQPEDILIEIIHRGEECDALKKVLGHVCQTLAEVDKNNKAGGKQIAHIFLYEPSEAIDLQHSLGYHLGDADVRAHLLELIRIFPPDEVVVQEPNYRGVHHLPATAVRSVLEQLYALPVKVGYDLASVSQALSRENNPPSFLYQPGPDFTQRFSSRLNVSHSQSVLHKKADDAAIRGDVDARLRSLAALVQWLLQENERASKPFLLLNKAPFLFQSEFHPLEASSLDILIAQELLENRSTRLATLVELARPAEERRERFRCFANLTLSGSNQAGFGGMSLTFSVPPESRQCELSSSSMGLILTNGEADIRLAPELWSQFEARISSDKTTSGTLVVYVSKKVFEGAAFQDVYRKTSGGGWFLDQSHLDLNTDRAVRFLRSLVKSNV